ncbi:MAG TPA: T9SS type A sorting domain-containing protein, partial [Chitinophagaceae bacterium]|nr:T9SS type A sorting domain-containing protein [Chitinophagaceae bacterium]
FSPVSIHMTQSNSHDSIHIKLILKKHAATSTDAALFLGLAEDSVFVNGGNGETEHYNVLRKSLTTAEGMLVSLDFPVGDSVMLNFSGKQASFWDPNRMFAIAMLSGKDDAKLIQSTKSALLRTTSISAVSTAENYSVWPNPAKDLLMIRTVEKGIVDYRIYDLLGKVVRQGDFTGNTTINIAGMPTGHYLLHLYSGSHSAPYRLLLQH